MADRPVAWITGASSGLGSEFARQLAARGYDLVLIARRRERLEQLARQLSVHCELIRSDLTLRSEQEILAQRLSQEPRLALLVNNAGFGTTRLFWEAELQGQLAMHELHVMAAVRLTHAALNNLVRQGQGGIINVASVAAFARSPANVSYCATKAWMLAFSEGLALELRARKSPVKVQALCPGFTYTEFHDVMGVDRNAVPRSWWMQAEEVVRASLEGLDRGQVCVIPGWRYRFLVAVLTKLPFALRMILQANSPHTRGRL
ncbi:MAG: SDR family oxidoreductase [Bryobacteraceae bacterium]|nr:SDR family oxidoreductase [Bryobacteraceae bacterium]MDW8379272.1 SDR family oxidoreductase [Bryobacterales bacterium]